MVVFQMEELKWKNLSSLPKMATSKYQLEILSKTFKKFIACSQQILK